MLTLAAAILGQRALAQDIAGSADHPMVSRYTGQVVGWHRIENVMPDKAPAGPVEGYRTIPKFERADGRVTRIFYKLETAGKTHTEVWRNSSDAIKEAGFTIIVGGVFAESSVSGGVGGGGWQDTIYRDNRGVTRAAT